MKIYAYNIGHIKKIAATPIYSKNPLKSSQDPVDRFPQNLVHCMYHRGLLPTIVCTNDDPGLTLTYFETRSNLEFNAFSIGKSENSGFSETVATCNMKVGRYRQLIELMKVCEY